jgi:hypothetical protein
MSLSSNGLQTALDSAISSLGTAELAILYLIDRYDFDLHDLRSRLQGLYSSRLTFFQRETSASRILSR